MGAEAFFGVGNSHFFANVGSVDLDGLAGNIHKICDLLNAFAVFDQVRYLNFGCREIGVFGGQFVKKSGRDFNQVVLQYGQIVKHLFVSRFFLGPFKVWQDAFV